MMSRFHWCFIRDHGLGFLSMVNSLVTLAAGFGRALAILLVMAVFTTTTHQAMAQDEASQTADQTQVPSSQDIDALIATLESDADRAAFIENLKTLSEAQQEIERGDRDHVVTGIAGWFEGAEDRFSNLFGELDDGSEIAGWFAEQARDGDLNRLWVEAAWKIVVTLGLGVLAMWLVHVATKRHLHELRGRDAVAWVERPLIALGRFSLRIVPVIAFVGVIYLSLVALHAGDLARTISIALANAFALTRVAMALVRTVLAPLSPELRILPMSDRQAAYILIWTGRFLGLGVYGFFATELLAALGLPEPSVAVLLRIVGLGLMLMAIIVILQSRQPVSTWIRENPEGGGARMLRHRLADVWHIVAMIAFGALYVVWALDVENGFLYLLRAFGFTALALFLALLLSAVLCRVLDRMFHIGDDLTRRFPGLEKRSNRYLAIVSWLLNILVWVIATFVIFESWGIEAIELATSHDGLDVMGRLLAVVVVGLVAVVVWEMGDGIISNYVRRSEESALSPRFLTLLPLLRNVLLIVVGAIAVMTALAEMGLDIGPLLAGAGVVGLAIGFGAQTLVKDVITGAFILFEDQFSVGDWIDAGGKMGGVEGITIRTVRLRDIDGYVHTVPFGEIAALTNMMRDFGYAVIDVGIAYQENTDKVIKVIRQVDEEARKDGDLAERLSGELEVMGVNALGDSSVTIRVRIKTLAGYQWGVRRDYLRLIKLRFDEVGIEIPFPHMTLYFGELKEGRTPPAIVRIDAHDPEPEVLERIAEDA